MVDVEAFRRSGYVIVKAVFSSGEVVGFRQRVEALVRREVSEGRQVIDPMYPKAVFISGDLLGKPELRDVDHVVFDKRVIACAKAILGERLVYFGDSSVQMGEGTRGFHKDNVDRTDGQGSDWRDDYTLIRVGLYLQDHSRHTGGLKVRVGSHRYVSRHRGRAVNIGSEPGDVIIWSLKTSHSGNNVRLRLLRQVCLHPRVERIMPAFLRAPEERERIAMFCTFGAPDQHLERYIEFQRRRGDYEEHWKRSGFSPEIVELAKSRGVALCKPIHEYGELYSSVRDGAAR